MIIEVRECLVPSCERAKHRLEWDEPTGREFKLIQEVLGLNPSQWEEQLERMAEEVDSTVIDVAIMILTIAHRRAGIPVAMEEVDFKINDLSFIVDEQAEVDAGEVPTVPPPTSPPPEAPEPPGTSGPAPEAASAAKSSTTEPASGGTTDSPSPQPQT